MLTFRFSSFLFFVALVLMASCKKEENFTSRISFFNGVVNTSSTLSLKADSVTIVQNIAYDSLRVNTALPSGTYALNLFSNAQSQSLLTFTTNLQANEAYTTVVYDSVQKPQFFMRKDELPVTPGAGRCAIRIFNLIPGSSNLFLGGFKAVINNKDSARAYVTGNNFGAFASSATGSAFTEIDTITRPRIYTADTSRLAELQTLLPGKIYTFYLTGSIKDSNRLHPKCIVQVHN
jgi:hypothetical protein